MIPESDEYYEGFPHAISSENEEKTSLTDYTLFYTLAECLYHRISREIFDGSEPALRAVIANGEIKFLARYTLEGACYYEPLGTFPRMPVNVARKRARELYNRFDDNRVPDEDYEHIPF
ncbi:DUF4102 domain-containing protein [Kluyvera ascorbata]|uniref:DUF4102 domain-containing protein n=1 Tax=Kluyvera ascorbata TaxID=51288 RepID=UPI0035CCE857